MPTHRCASVIVLLTHFCLQLQGGTSEVGSRLQWLDRQFNRVHDQARLRAVAWQSARHGQTARWQQVTCVRADIGCPTFARESRSNAPLISVLAFVYIHDGLFDSIFSIALRHDLISQLLISKTVKMLLIVLLVQSIFSLLVLSSSATTMNTTDRWNFTDCRKVDAFDIKCDFNTSCVYGELNTVQCKLKHDIRCQGERAFAVTFPCLYCWQLPEDAYTCDQNTTCKTNTRYLTVCNVNSNTFCMGHRIFSRYKQCNNVTGHKWSMALVLSVLFGGFGVDRFYLGHWQEGVGKLFSFGGFGVWTLVDTILIAIGYLKPVDSSHYEL